MSCGHMSTTRRPTTPGSTPCEASLRPLFKAQLRGRLRAQEPAARHADRDWPRRALIAAAAVTRRSRVLIAVPGVRASVAQFVSLFRVVNVVGGAGRFQSPRSAEGRETWTIGTLIGEHVQVVQDPGPPVPSRRWPTRRPPPA